MRAVESSDGGFEVEGSTPKLGAVWPRFPPECINTQVVVKVLPKPFICDEPLNAVTGYGFRLQRS